MAGDDLLGKTDLSLAEFFPDGFDGQLQLGGQGKKDEGMLALKVEFLWRNVQAARTAMGHSRRRMPPWGLGPSAESPSKVIK